MEESLVVAINGLRTPALDGVLGFLGEWALFAYPIVLLALASRRAHGAGARDGMVAFLLALFVSEMVLKPLIGRARPTAIPALLERLHVLGSVPSARSFSMPSGTAAACAAGAAWLWIRFGPRAGVPAALLAILAGFARLYAGVHWPSDVVVGAALGIAIAVGVDRHARWAR